MSGSRRGQDRWRLRGGSSAREVERLAAERTPSKPRPGYDVTLRPPKSVSVLWALAEPGDRAEIRQAHTEAVDEVVRYLEDRAVRARLSGNDGRYLKETDGLIAAAFDHRTSRAGDPLLHTHVVVANMTRVDSDDGPVWRAIAGPGPVRARQGGRPSVPGASAPPADRTARAWSGVRSTNGYADVVGVPAEVIETFSKRRTEIAEVMAESGNTSARAAQIATLETRKPKDYQVDPDTLFDQWRDEADAVGFGTERGQRRACTRPRSSRSRPRGSRRAFDELAGPAGLTERASVFRRSDVIEALSSRVSMPAPRPRSRCWPMDSWPPTIALWSTGLHLDLHRADDSTAPRPARVRRSSTQTTYTTSELAEIEAELLLWAGDTAAARTPALPTAAVAGALGERPELTAEQSAMVQSVCDHTAAVVPIAGRPGAGKTYAVEAIVAAHVAAGVPIVGCAVSATAAAELERAAGFSRSTQAATTVAKLVMDLDRWGGLAPGSVVVVDEASMLATRDLHRLVAHARRAAGSVVLVGDPDQHGAVEVGGVFQRLCRDRGESLVRLVENNRQTDHVDRLAIASTATAMSPTRSPASTTLVGWSGRRRRGSPSTPWWPTGTPITSKAGPIR